MSTLSKNKARFRDNLKQFIELKEAGKLNGAATQIKEKLKTAAGVVDLDFLKEYKTAYKDISRENPSNDSTGRQNIINGIEAMKTVIETQQDIDRAMRHPKLGWISFIWGRKGNKQKSFAGGYGISHIIAKRNDEGKTDPTYKNQKGKDVALRLPIVIEKGTITKPYEKGRKRDIEFAGYKVILRLDKDGKSKKWVLSGFRMPQNRKNPDDAGEFQTLIRHYASEGYLDIRPKMGAGFKSQNTQNSDKRENPCGCEARLNPEVDLVGIQEVPHGDVRDNPGVKPDEIYQMITDMVINTIKEKGHLPWQKEWDDSGLSGGKTATNFVSGNAYRGINFFMLNFRQVENEDGELTIEMINFDNPYFLTFNQVEDLGGKVKKDSRGHKVVYFTKLYKIEQSDPEIDFGTYSLEEMTDFVKDNYDDIERTRGRTPEQVARSKYLPILKYYNVFHAADIEGIDWGTLPKNDNADKPAEFKIEVAKAIYDNFPNAPEVKHVEPRAYYKPDMDFINMPPLERFDEEQFYHTTLFHEATHSTGHKSRLGRELSQDKQKYAFEELIAEMGAIFLCAESGILFRTIDNSASYLQSWNKRLVKKMKDDNRFFFRAASRAQAAADYILDRNDEGIPAYRNDVKVETEEREPVRANPETDTVCVDDITCEVTVKANTNAAKGGIEIRFSDPPPKIFAGS